MRLADRNGMVREERSGQDRLLEWMYGHLAGRILLKPLIQPKVSVLAGRVLDSKLSAFAVKLFLMRHPIDLAQCTAQKFSSYNDFFTRKLKPGARKIERAPERMISPCDGRLSVYPIRKSCTVRIKHTEYTLENLLRNRELARRYQGGYLWVFRLCVEDYHRYLYIDDGIKSENIRIPGVFHTVNPAANDVYPIYKENTREYSLLMSEHFGTVLMMEVGALLVGRIENRHGAARVRRGQEKGNFAFGGSTILLMTQEGAALPDPDILANSAENTETRVRMGEAVGRAGKALTGVMKQEDER